MKLDSLIAAKDRAAQFMMDDIKMICTTMPKRDPGSEGEKQVCDYFAKLCTEEYGCEEAHVESFKEHPMSFFGWIRFTFTMTIVAAILCFFKVKALAAVSLVLSLGGWLIAILQFGMYLPIVDRFFPEMTGHNVWATKKPKGEVKARVLFCGHCDAVWEWPVNYALGGVCFEGHLVISAIGTLYYLAVAIMILCGANPETVKSMCLWGLLFIPFEIGMFFMWTWWDPHHDKRNIVDGANDNLSGCYMGLAVLKELKEQGIELEHTEFGIVNVGSEEAGLRGSKAWCKAHKGEFDDVPTFIYSFDTIFDPKFLLANYRDLNATIKTDEALGDLFVKSAEELGLHCGKGVVPPLGGATDGAAFCQAGMRAFSVTGLNHKLENYYHTRRDTWDNMNKQGLADCYAVSCKVLEYIENGYMEDK